MRMLTIPYTLTLQAGLPPSAAARHAATSSPTDCDTGQQAPETSSSTVCRTSVRSPTFCKTPFCTRRT